MQEGERKFARILIPSTLKEPLTYALPPLLQESLRIGMRVLVPLGKRRVTGVVADFLAKTPLLKGIKEIQAVLDDRPVLDRSLLKLIDWTSRYYLASTGEVLATILPPGLRAQSSIVIVPKAGEFPDASDLEIKILDEARRRKGRLTIRSLARRVPQRGLHHALNRLSTMGAVELRDRMPGRQRLSRLIGDPPGFPAAVSHDSVKKIELTPEQQRALHLIRSRLNQGGYETFLLYGVTGSGKTEIYLQAMEHAKKAGRRSLILVPEISLTPQLLHRLAERFPTRVGVLHSALTSSERWAQWWRILDGSVDVVVGARSAVFAPLPDLGLIVVDEEHDPSYKQEEGLRYHARDLAVVRGNLLGCPVILGTATPAVESFENCRQGRYRLLELTRRVERRPLPRVETVDLRVDREAAVDKGEGISPRFRSMPALSSRLAEALQRNFVRGRQSLIFLNRRGFANFLQCRLCGHVLRCSHCSVSLTFHLKQQSLCCHHCGFRQASRDLCTNCGNLSLAGIGFGTETVEQEIARLIPRARIARMDRDTTSKRGAQQRLLRSWERGEIDVLVGTQMITKGHDVSGVTLVGVILADLSLNLPDFRAAERTFQLLAQVAGRAGRGEELGGVIIQTYAPDHYAIRCAMDHDFKGFFESEIEFRRTLNYPPFSRLVHLRLEGPSPQDVEAKAKQLGEELRKEYSRNDKIEILGPAPAPIEKLRGRYRWQILVKGTKSTALLELAQRARGILPGSRKTRLFVDVDPYNML